MPINPVCDICETELKDYGGLYFTPSRAPGYKVTEKYHVCRSAIKPASSRYLKRSVSKVTLRGR